MNEITIYDETTFQIIEKSDPASTDATFLDLWLRGKSEKTRRAYLADIRTFYDAVGKPLRSVTLEDVYTFVDSLAHLKPTSRNRAVAAVKSAFYPLDSNQAISASM
jgi:site-specific recombinase XerD